MSLKEGNGVFFVLYSNGDTFYFTVENSEIYCTKFKKAYEYFRKNSMPGANILEFTGDSFSLKNESGELIYSLDDYNKEIRNIVPIPDEKTTIVMLYIDDDVKTYLLNKGMLKYDEQASYIPGLLEITTEEEQKPKGISRVKRP